MEKHESCRSENLERKGLVIEVKNKRKNCAAVPLLPWAKERMFCEAKNIHPLWFHERIVHKVKWDLCDCILTNIAQNGQMFWKSQGGELQGKSGNPVCCALGHSHFQLTPTHLTANKRPTLTQLSDLLHCLWWISRPLTVWHTPVKGEVQIVFLGRTVPTGGPMFVSVVGVEDPLPPSVKEGGGLGLDTGGHKWISGDSLSLSVLRLINCTHFLLPRKAYKIHMTYFRGGGLFERNHSVFCQPNPPPSKLGGECNRPTHTVLPCLSPPPFRSFWATFGFTLFLIFSRNSVLVAGNDRKSQMQLNGQSFCDWNTISTKLSKEVSVSRVLTQSEQLNACQCVACATHHLSRPESSLTSVSCLNLKPICCPFPAEDFKKKIWPTSEMLFTNKWHEKSRNVHRKIQKVSVWLRKLPRTARVTERCTHRRTRQSFYKRACARDKMENKKFRAVEQTKFTDAFFWLSLALHSPLQLHADVRRQNASPFDRRKRNKLLERTCESSGEERGSMASCIANDVLPESIFIGIRFAEDKWVLCDWKRKTESRGSRKLLTSLVNPD